MGVKAYPGNEHREEERQGVFDIRPYSRVRLRNVQVLETDPLR